MFKTVALFALAALVTGSVLAKQHHHTEEPGVVLTDHDNHRKVTLRVGEMIVIKLPFHGGTAYTWKALKVPDFVTPVKDEEAGPAMITREDRKSWAFMRYRGTVPGEGWLKLGMRSATGRQVARDFEVKLTVQR